MKLYSDGIAASNLSRLYRNEFGIDLDYHDIGYDSLKSFLKECSEAVKLTQEGSTLVVNPAGRGKSFCDYDGIRFFW